MLPRVTSKTGYASAIVSAAVQGYLSPLRSQQQPAVALHTELPIIAQQYGAREKIEKHILQECIRLVLEKFRALGLNEIREAYRLKASGFLEAPGAEMWGGTFNADQLGKVLTAYVDHRRRIVAAYIEEQEREQEKEKARQRREDFNRRFPDMIGKAKQEITDWREVPEYWYDAAMRRGWIEFGPGEAQGIFSEAKELARMEFEEEMEAAPVAQKAALQAAVLGQGDDLDFRAKVYARKISVFRKIIIQ